MLVIIFSYNREAMLEGLISELTASIRTESEGVVTLTPSSNDVVIIDDGSDWVKGRGGNVPRGKNTTFIRTHHEGKKGFWKKWVMARQIALGSEHDYFLLIPDDISKLDLGTIKDITRQGWEDSLFAVNVINCGRKDCWGSYFTGQEPIQVNGVTLKEVGFVDCGFLTNRHTLENIDIHEVSPEWFDRPDKSSGVGYQMSTSMRLIGTKMMMPTPGLCFHGEHESVMHKEHRIKTPLTSK